MTTNTLDLVNIKKYFPTPQGEFFAVKDVSLSFRDGEFFTMLGPSGCGKTTTLRMIAGLEKPSSGRILINGADMAGMSPMERKLGMVFQSYALFPHMTMFDNIAYGLRVRKVPEAEIKRRVEAMIAVVGLTALSKRYPADLSGGQQQRMSIARALVYNPSLLLLDEPLANLDAKLRIEMREEIRRIQRELGILTIYVTHDQEEAMSISDRIAVFNEGRVEQLGVPHDIYANPSTLFAADFMGKANFFPAARPDAVTTADTYVLSDGKAVETRLSLSSQPLDGLLPDTACDAIVMVRPEHVELSADPNQGTACTIKRVQFLGSFTRYVAESALSPRDLFIDLARPIEGLSEGNPAAFSFRPQDCIAYIR